MTASSPGPGPADGGPPARVRVTGPPRRRTPLGRAREREEQAALDELYVGSLLRDQLGLALRTLAWVVAVPGLAPLVFWRWPGLAERHVLGVPSAWLVLGVGAYPFLLGLGWRHLRRAERTEDAFAELVAQSDPWSGDR